MPDPIVLGEYELIGIHDSDISDFVELRLRLLGKNPDPLEAKNFDHGTLTSVVIPDRKPVEQLKRRQKFRIVLERME
jgi:hypothetical protein